MSGGALPPVAAPVLAEAVERLPARLRGRLDDATARAAGWAVTADGDTYTVAVDEGTTVTLVTAGGAVRTADDARCGCLLAPNCLHRAAVLARAPVLDDGPAPPDVTDAGADGVSSDAAPTVGVGSAVRTVDAVRAGDGVGVGGVVRAADAAGAGEAPEVLTPPQVAAVEHLWRAAVDVMGAGVTGSGVVARAALLRAAHDAQATGVYRAAAAARAVAAQLQAARDGAPQFRLADLTDTLRDLLTVLHRLRRTGDADLLGTARRRYELRGSLRLYGLCTTAVVADSGYAGVVTYLVDRDGTIWTTSDLAPGDAHRAAGAGNATVRIGESALTHRALTRAGLIVSGATASGTRQLGAGTSVRAVTSSGASWHDGPLARLWAQPLEAQVHRAFEALALPVADRTAGDDLLFLSVRVTGTDGDAVEAVTEEAAPLTLRVATDHPAFGYRENLRLLARHPGLPMLVVGRPDPGRRATVYPLAVAPADPAGWPLPPTLAGHVDLAFDRLHRTHLPAGGGAPRTAEVEDHRPADPGLDSDDPTPDAGTPGTDATGTDATDTDATGTDATGTDATGTDATGTDATGTDATGTDAGDAAGGWRPAVAADPALHLLRRGVERAVSGGRSALAFSGPQRHPTEARQLRRARLETGSAVLDVLTSAAVARPRDAFGRLAGDDGTAFAQAWLAAAVYSDAAFRAFGEASWLPSGPPPTG